MARDRLDREELADPVLRKMVAFSGVGLFETDLDGRIRYANDQLARLLGYADAAALLACGRTASSFYVDPEDQVRVRATVEATGRIDGAVYAVRRADNQQIWVSEHGTALRGPDGEIIGYIGSLSDVTELVETQLRLAQAEADYRRIFERATEGIYRSSLDGKQLRSNPALNHLNGYETEEEHLAGVKDIATEWYVDPHRRDEFKALLAKNGFVENFESEIFAHKSRRRLWISENAYLVRDADGAPLFYEGTVRDITDRKAAELALRKALEEAESASRAKSTFMASVSHELRTPLNAILGFSDLILSHPRADLAVDTVRDYALHINESGRHLLALINDILDLARIEAGARVLEPEALAADAVLADAVGTLRPLLQEKAIDVQIAPEQGLCLHADRRAMHQCMLNVLSNAIKFSARGQTIVIACAGEDGLARTMVTDRGEGMPPELIARLGEPFLIDENQPKSATPGTGLGLAITHSLLDQMGGALAIESTPGQGTTVTLSVPESLKDGWNRR